MNNLGYIAEQSDGVGSYRLAAVVKLGKTAFIGTNHRKSHPALAMCGKLGTVYSSHHAELDALFRAQRLLGEKFDRSVHKVKIKVLRINRHNQRVLAKPCLHCQRKMREIGILAKNIWFTNDSGAWENLKEFDKGSI